ncbi:substrate-binding periplasmic protein [Neptuniibacter sp. QD72_48]|uniref:substrate-binding periplasmic protein n=1 Tax=Neptuniibacter sp. QD72_48 TaxID=3398214 RepID=UPI0039F63E6D
MFANEELQLLTEDYAPLNFVENGALVGPSVEVVQRIFERVELNADIKIYPWARSYELALHKPNYAVFSTSRTPQREKLFRWVGPLAEKRFSFYSLKDFKGNLFKAKDAINYKVGVQNRSAAHQTLKSLGFNKLHPVAYEVQNLKMLKLKRIDLWYTSNSSFGAAIKKLNVPRHQFREVYVDQSLRQYIAFNLGTSKALINKIQLELDKLVDSNEYFLIFEKYHAQELIPEIYRNK